MIHQVNDISSTIATAVEEQSATTNEMTRNVADAAEGSSENHSQHCRSRRSCAGYFDECAGITKGRQ